MAAKVSARRPGRLRDADADHAPRVRLVPRFPSRRSDDETPRFAPPPWP